MSGRYDDILDLTHHVSKKRKQMSMHDRAAQFSPFAALTGYDAAIRETGRLTDRQIEHAADGAAMLDEKLRLLAARLAQQPEITVTYFVPDERKNGGAYVDARGRLRRIDRLGGALVLEDGTRIPFGRIYDISGELLWET